MGAPPTVQYFRDATECRDFANRPIPDPMLDGKDDVEPPRRYCQTSRVNIASTLSPAAEAKTAASAKQEPKPTFSPDWPRSVVAYLNN